MDATWMAEAIEAASPTRPHPNPRVGAIVVDRAGRQLARESHPGVGALHAEDAALQAAGGEAAGGTLYVTLEPCTHFGKAPPCVDAIIASGVHKVVIGAVDPDRRVAGRGVVALEKAGIDVTVGVLAEEVEAADPAYFHHRRTGRPMVTLKAAVTLDGQVAASNGSSQWITGPIARIDAHQLRSESDAVVIGAGTLRVDDPQLTVRLESYEGSQPTPVAIVGRNPIPDTVRLLDREDLIIVSPIERPEIERRVLVVPDENREWVDLPEAVELLGSEGLLALLVEGGSALFSALLSESLVDRLILYYGSRLAGGTGRPLFQGSFDALTDAKSWRITDVALLGEDLRVEAVPGHT